MDSVVSPPPPPHLGETEGGGGGGGGGDGCFSLVPGELVRIPMEMEVTPLAADVEKAGGVNMRVPCGRGGTVGVLGLTV